MTVLTLDRLPKRVRDGQTEDWVAHVVLQDGAVHTTPVGAFDLAAGTCTLDPPLPSDPLAGAVCVLENATTPSTLWRVLSVRETDGPGLEFLARQYDPGRYAAAETGFRLDTPALEPAQGPIPAPASVSLNKRSYEDGATAGSILAIGVVDPAGGRDTRAAGIEVQLGRTRDGHTHYRPVEFTDSGFAEVTGVGPGTYRARARYVAQSGVVRSPWTASSEEPVAAAEALGEPDRVTVTPVPGGYNASWKRPPQRDYAYTEILERVGDAPAHVKGRSAYSPWPRLGLEPTALHVSIRHVDRAGRPTNASAEFEVTPGEVDIEAARTAATEAAASATAAAGNATQAREAVAGIADSVATEVNSRLDTTLAPAVVLREKAGDATRLELVGLADLTGSPSTAEIDAGALRLGDDFEVASDGNLALSGTARGIAALWSGSTEVPANGNVVEFDLSADMRPYGVMDGVGVAGASPYAAVPLAIVVAGAVAGSASARPAAARKFAVVLDAARSTEVYYWRSADGETLYLQNDTASRTAHALRLLSLTGVRNSGVAAPPAPS